MKSCTNGNVRTKTTAEARTKFFQSEVLHAIFTQGAVLCIASNNTTVVNKHSILVALSASLATEQESKISSCRPFF